MAWVDMRCPKCGEILPDFVDSCYTCDYKFIAKEYDPQTYPDTRKRDKELWKYKYDTVFCKTFLHKIAKTFCRSLQLHFVGNCKPGWQSWYLPAI